MRSRKSDKFPRRYDLGFLPESWKVPLIARDQVVGAGSVGAFQEDIVVGIARDFKTPRRYDGVTVVPDELEQLLPDPCGCGAQGGKAPRCIPPGWDATQ
jgi:hypothetical protein